MKMNPDQFYIELLHKKVIEKIKASWTPEWAIQFGKHFSSVSELINKDAFFIEIKDEIDQILTSKFGFQKGVDKSISKDSVGRFLNDGGSRGYQEKTKNAFSIYVGYENFQDFCVSNIQNVDNDKRKRILWYGVAASLILAFLVYLITPLASGVSSVSAEVMKLESKDVFVNEPLVVQTNLQPKCEGCFLEIMGQVQNVETKKGSTDLYIRKPGLADLHLVKNEEIIATEKVLVKTKEWFCSINQNLPVELSHVKQNGYFQLRDDPATSGFGEYYTNFQYFDNFGLSTDDLVFETRVRNQKEPGGIWAYDVSIDIVGTENAASFNFLAPDALIYEHVKIADTDFVKPAERSKLQPFAVYMEDWTDVKVIFKNQTATFFLDGKQIFETSYKGELGDFVGISYYFKGCGAVDHVKVSRPDGSTVFEDDFSR